MSRQTKEAQLPNRNGRLAALSKAAIGCGLPIDLFHPVPQYFSHQAAQNVMERASPTYTEVHLHRAWHSASRHWKT